MPIHPYALAFATVVLGTIVAKVYLSIARKITARMKIDKSVAKVYELPFSVVIFLVALYIGLTFIEFPADLAEGLTRTIVFVILMICTYSFAQFLEAFLKRYLLTIAAEYEARVYSQLLAFFGTLLKGTLLAIAAVIILANFGYDVVAILAGFGVFGLAVALAATDILKDIFGGLFICITRLFVVGDFIDVDGVARGRVERVDLLRTCLRSEKGDVIAVPNSRIRTARITILAQPKTSKAEEKLHEEIVINLPYAIPTSQLNKLIKVVLAQIKGTKGCAKPSYKVELSDKVKLTIAYEIVDVPKANAIRNRVNLKIKRELEKGKIALS